MAISKYTKLFWWILLAAIIILAMGIFLGWDFFRIYVYYNSEAISLISIVIAIFISGILFGFFIGMYRALVELAKYEKEKEQQERERRKLKEEIRRELEMERKEEK